MAFLQSLSVFVLTILIFYKHFHGLSWMNGVLTIGLHVNINLCIHTHFLKTFRKVLKNSLNIRKMQPTLYLANI